MNMPNKERNAFTELLAILSEEELIRLCRRSQIADNHWLAEILHDELVDKYGHSEENAARFRAG